MHLFLRMHVSFLFGCRMQNNQTGKTFKFYKTVIIDFAPYRLLRDSGQFIREHVNNLLIVWLSLYFEVFMISMGLVEG